MRTLFYVLTPAGKSGPYYTRQAADDAARPFGWIVVVERAPDPNVKKRG